MTVRLTAVVAGRFMRAALGHVAREYPHKLDHVLGGGGDARTPRDLHPVFFGSFDWQSCVLGWWLLLTLARRYPGLPEATQVRDLAIATFTRDKIEAELAYLSRASAGDFGRPYGWAWLLTLHAEAARHHQPWARALDPLAAAFAIRFVDWLPRAAYPVRSGGHGNTAFAMIHAHAWAVEYHVDLALALAAKARAWYLDDSAVVLREPDGDAFLSPLLTEALCMQRLLPPGEFEPWFAELFPRLDDGEPVALFEPVYALDRTNGDAALVDGLNLSRAWSWRMLGRGLPLGHIVHHAAERHLAAAMPSLAEGETAEPWLASFALLALLPDSP